MNLMYRNQSQGQKILNVMLLIAFLTLIISYIIGVANGHHEPWLPTISELDEETPEGTLWSAGLSLAGIMSIPVWTLLSIIVCHPIPCLNQLQDLLGHTFQTQDN